MAKKKENKESKWDYLKTGKIQSSSSAPTEKGSTKQSKTNLKIIHYPLRNKGKLRKRSKKKEDSDKKKIKSYIEYDLRMQQEGMVYCGGCHHTSSLSHSHTLSEKWCNENGRPELIWDQKNYGYHCMSMEKTGCHDIWESGDIEKMMELKDFWPRVEYIKTISIEEYNKIMIKVDEYRNK